LEIEHEIDTLSISVVIPTTGRPTLHAAVESALRQSRQVLEVLVVADTTDEVVTPEDARVRVIRVGPGAGGNVARQRGVEEAAGEVVALLDDDDEWFPEKLRLQLRSVIGAPRGLWISTCRLQATFEDGSTAIWPEAPIEAGETLPRYLFARKKLRGGHGLIQSSTLVFPTSLARRIPFDAKLPFHQDIGWLMDVVNSEPAVLIDQVWEPLVVFNIRGGSLSRSITIDGSITWAVDHLGPIDRKLVGDFILTQTMNVARQQISTPRAIHTFKMGNRVGSPSILAEIHALSVIAETLIRSGGRRLKRAQ
jgi:glycosyltransferase involved in cell wall biosynthesis